MDKLRRNKMNSFNITGNLCKDIELKQAKNGKTVATFDIAVKRPYSSTESDFFTCVAWEKKAEYLHQYAKKGSRVAVSGYITTRKWTDKNGANRTSYEVQCEGVETLSNSTQSTETYNPYNNPTPPFQINMADISTVETDEDLPF
jgi:single-strand DNA-binding protein